MLFVVVVFPFLCNLQLLSQFLEVSLALLLFPFFWHEIRVICSLPKYPTMWALILHGVQGNKDCLHSA